MIRYGQRTIPAQCWLKSRYAAVFRQAAVSPNRVHVKGFRKVKAHDHVKPDSTLQEIIDIRGNGTADALAKLAARRHVMEGDLAECRVYAKEVERNASEVYRVGRVAAEILALWPWVRGVRPQKQRSGAAKGWQ